MVWSRGLSYDLQNSLVNQLCTLLTRKGAVLLLVFGGTKRNNTWAKTRMWQVSRWGSRRHLHSGLCKGLPWPCDIMKVRAAKFRQQEHVNKNTSSTPKEVLGGMLSARIRWWETCAGSQLCPAWHCDIIALIPLLSICMYNWFTWLTMLSRNVFFSTHPDTHMS